MLYPSLGVGVALAFITVLWDYFVYFVFMHFAWSWAKRDMKSGGLWAERKGKQATYYHRAITNEENTVEKNLLAFEQILWVRW